MCGIAAGVRMNAGQADAALRELAHRGPDARGIFGGPTALVHTRLAILDLDPRSDQPMTRGGTTVSYNGELWNHAAVRLELEAAGRRFTTSGDTEVIAAALDEWGEEALPRLEGMFAVAWLGRDGRLRAARDRFGEVPLHVGHDGSGRLRVASEVRALIAVGAVPASARFLPPGSVLREVDGGSEIRSWYSPRARAGPVRDIEVGSAGLRLRLGAAVRERRISDAPVCILLSGGIDSAAIASILRREIPDLVAFTAVMDRRSPDLRAARIVAGHLGLPLREVVVPPPSADDLARVVSDIEMPHKAQVEIAWPCLFLARAMRAEGFKVTFSGEGSDELWASYGFAFYGLRSGDWYSYRRGLFLDQHRKNFARCNKVFLRHSVECRLPFLNTALVEYALSLPRDVVERGRVQKAVLREAFRGELPDLVVDRPKLAFQDGLGLKRAAESAVHDPKRFYRATYETALRAPVQ